MDDDGKPRTLDIKHETISNQNFRTTTWTGKHLQLTVMSIEPGDDIGLEVHPDTDQFIRVEEGHGRCQMGPSDNDLSFDEEVGDDWAVLVPAGTWHNITNIGDTSLKVYALYGPPDHARGTIHPNHEDARQDPAES